MYDFVIKIYVFLIKLAALAGNDKAKKWIEGRKNIFSKLFKTINKDTPLILIHCSSLGEFEQGRPLIEAIKQNFPSYKILLTFFSPSGYEIRKNYKNADYIFYLPADTKKNSTLLIENLNIKLAIFVKYEFWKNYIEKLHNKKIPVILISAIFRPKQLFFKWYGKSYAKILKYFTHIFVQNEESAKLLKNIGIYKNVTIAGDTRFDRVYEIYKAGQPDNIVKKFASFSDKPIIVGGSTWDKDEEILTKFINTEKNVRLIIAPHEVSKEHITRITKLLKTSYSLYTNTISPTSVLIINTIGVLNKAYRIAKIAYIGGGFSSGIHNILEAAVYGVPVIFGPNYQKFKEANDLIKAKAAFSIKNYTEFKDIVEKLNTDSKFYKQASEAAQQYIKDNIGATKKILSIISKKLKNDKEKN